MTKAINELPLTFQKLPKSKVHVAQFLISVNIQGLFDIQIWPLVSLSVNQSVSQLYV